ncbi:MAG: hypothetical protein ACTSW1_00705 [Candidatus Hodarchaeales archaeon]
MKKPMLLVVAVVLGIVGIALLLHSLGYLSIDLPYSVATTQGKMGVKVSTDFQRSNFLALVGPGATYKWKLVGKNTGDLDWSESHVTVRLSIPGASVVDKTEPDVQGTFKVEKCGSRIDDISCREDIKNTWNIEMCVIKPGETCGDKSAGWTKPPCDDAGTYKRVCSITWGPMSAGQEKTAFFRIRVPSDVSKGQRYLITNLVATHGVYNAIDSKAEQINIGTISGTLGLEFLGAIVLSILAIILAVTAFV